LWLLALVIAAVLVGRTPFLADMSIFLPRNPDPAQTILAQGMQSGPGARTLLVAVQGVPQQRRAKVSRELAKRWEAIDGVSSALNGRSSSLAADEALLFDVRYLLASGLTANEFSDEQMRASVTRTISLLRGGVGLFAKDKILRDPTGAAPRVFESVSDKNRPRTENGVWVTRDGQSLLFVVRTSAQGTDLDAQEKVLADLNLAFDQLRIDSKLDDAAISVSGPPLFAVQSRDMIRGDVVRLSTIGVGLIVLFLVFVFRSVPAVLLTLVPMFSAVAVGAAAVAAVFGSLHGLTLGFGAALIGETVDYAIYHLSSVRNKNSNRAVWGPVRLGVMTSVIGFAVLLLSGFPGLAQIAVFAICGLTAGYLVAKWVLPALTPGQFAPRSLAGVGQLAHRLMGAGSFARILIGSVTIGALLFSLTHRDQLWDSDIAALNPIARSAQQMDQVLRESLGEQGARVMVMVRAGNESDAFEAAHQVTAVMSSVGKAVNATGFSSPTQILAPPSVQLANQAALPAEQLLQQVLARATEGQLLSAEKFKQFVDDVQAARERKPLTVADFTGTQIGTRLSTLLIPGSEEYTALIPVNDPSTGEIDITALRAAMPKLSGATVNVLDLKAQTNNLYGGYLREAVTLSALGGLAIVALLAWRLRSTRALVSIAVPVVATLSIVIALLVFAGQSLHLLHLIGLLLVAAVGSNYALVVGQYHKDPAPEPATLGALCVANATTLCGYGVLAASSVPLLSALGMTVGLGAPLVLLVSLLWIGHGESTLSGRAN
jgi:predicted exporter